MSKKSPKTNKKTNAQEYGPNKITDAHFKMAVDIAKKCRPEVTGKLHPNVGAVIVKKGKVIAHAYRGEAGRAEHAEYIALEKKAGGDPNVQGADLITTLEPCTVRSHDKRPCVSWIKSRSIRKVWIATLDPNPVIAGYGELQLQEDGIRIGRFPDNLADEVLHDNKEFFEWVRLKQPTISRIDQKKERFVIIDAIKESINGFNQLRSLLYDRFLSPLSGKKDRNESKEVLGLLNDTINTFEKALEQALAVQIDSEGSWVQLGSLLTDLKLHGIALLSYRVATEIDATSNYAWTGLTLSELELNRKDVTWPFQYSITPIDRSPFQKRSKTWLRFSEFEKPDMKVRIAARALQLGQKLDDIWPIVEKAAEEIMISEKRKEKESLQKEKMAWVEMSVMMGSLGEEEKQSFCLSIAAKNPSRSKLSGPAKMMWDLATGDLNLDESEE